MTAEDAKPSQEMQQLMQQEQQALAMTMSFMARCLSQEKHLLDTVEKSINPPIIQIPGKQ